MGSIMKRAGLTLRGLLAAPAGDDAWPLVIGPSATYGDERFEPSWDNVRGSDKVGVHSRDESRGKDYRPNCNRVECNRVTDSGGEDGVDIDVRGKTLDFRATGSARLRGSSSRTGLGIANGTHGIVPTDNRFEGFAAGVLTPGCFGLNPYGPSTSLPSRS